MRKSLDMTNSKKEKDEVCTNCGSNKGYDSTEFFRCCECDCESKKTKSVESSPLNQSTRTENKYKLRKDKLRRNSFKSKIEIKQEPELIELLSSEDEDSKAQNENRSNNLDENSNKNEKTNDLQKTPLQFVKYVFREWDIRESDIETFEKVTNGRCINNKFDDPDQIIEKKVKNFRLGSFISNINSTLQLSSEGLEFKLTIKDEDEDEDFLVSITVCIQDIVYCAILFHYPVYVLLFKIHDTTSNLYYNQLKELKSFQASHIDQSNKSRIAAVLDLQRSEVNETCFQFYNFFKKIQVSTENPTRFNFIKLQKSKQLIYNIFRNDKNLNDIVNFTKECLADDLAKSILKYPNGDDAVVINYGDLACLDDGVFLNDNIISFYLKFLQYEVLTEQDRKRTHIFDTFFYQCLTTKSQKKSKDDAILTAAEKRHARVKNWTRNVNLFEKDFLIVPINKNSHWYLVIICYPYLSEPVYDEATEDMDKSEDVIKLKSEDSNDSNTTSSTKSEKLTSDTATRLFIDSDISADEADEEDSNFSTLFSNNKENNKICTKMPIILVFDSLISTKRTRVIATLREYLQCEWKAKFGSDEKPLDKLAGTAVKVPTQTNYFDCGIYLLQYVEQFFKDPITDYTHPIKLDKWFTTETISKKREQIKNIIIKKSKEKPKPLVKIEPPTLIEEEKTSHSKQNGCFKKPISNGNHRLEDETDPDSETKTKVKKLKNETHHFISDSPKSPVFTSTRSFYKKDQLDNKSKHILDDMDNLI